MKNTSFIAIALLFGAVANAQTTPTTPVTDTTANPATVLVDTSVGKAYVANPESLKGLTTETLTMAHIFPALGSYKANRTSTGDVTITLDSVNKGIVWVEGLPQGKFRALMKKAPSTYKIPAQKSESGKQVPEGTLYVNPGTNELTVLLGQPFNDANPSTSLTIGSKKKIAWQYTGIKADAAVAPPASSQQQ